MSAEFEQSRFDAGWYFLRVQGKLRGICGMHVDDCATWGEGSEYHKALSSGSGGLGMVISVELDAPKMLPLERLP